MNLVGQFRAVMPSIIKTINPAIVDGRSGVDRADDGMSGSADAVAIVYSSNLSADDLRVLSAFYKTTPKTAFPAETPGTIREPWQPEIQRSGAADMRQGMIEELRQQGCDL